MNHLDTLRLFFAGATTKPNALDGFDAVHLRRCMNLGLIRLDGAAIGLRANGRLTAARPLALTLTPAGKDALIASSPNCATCGRIVLGYVPSPDGKGRPICSITCANRATCEHCGGVLQLRPGGGHEPGCVDAPITLLSNGDVLDGAGQRTHRFGEPGPMPTRDAESQALADRRENRARRAAARPAPAPISLLQRIRAYCTGADLVADTAPEAWPTFVLAHLHEHDASGLAHLLAAFAMDDGEIVDGDCLIEALNALGYHKLPAPVVTRSQKKNAKRDAARRAARDEKRAAAARDERLAERLRVASDRTARNQRAAGKVST